jgi:hypothetical protein
VYEKRSYGSSSGAVDLFGSLGRMLIKHSDESNAKIALRQDIVCRNGIMVYKDVQCDGCDLSITCTMGRFVCRDCPDCDLCGECLIAHQTGMKEVPTCSHDSFLEITSQTPSGPEQGIVMDEAPQTSWFQDLMVRYPEKTA